MIKYPLAALAAGLFLAGTAAHAQTTQQGSHNPVVKNSHTHMLASPAHGANSFSEKQAKGRLEKAGFTNVSKLHKDKSGVWRGTAEKNGGRIPVGLDYKGNVVTR